ncbi:MAG: hypothetical protein KBF93_11810 [Leptospiraceae bacterium]|nr:hypothetical protein [Leptospiraceae bacterium]
MSTLSLQKLKSFEQTVNYIKKNITEYWTDILLYPELLQLSPFQFFRFIQRCPYVADPKGIEFVTRPKILLEIYFSDNSFYFDCDDRTGLSGAYFKARNKLFGEKNTGKIIVSGEPQAVKKTMDLSGLPHYINVPHHVYLLVNGYSFDPTYPENQYGKKLFKEAFYKEYPVNLD